MVELTVRRKLTFAVMITEICILANALKYMN